MKAYGLNSDNTGAKAFTITMGYETEDGEKGFLATKHAFGLDDTGNEVYRDINGSTLIDKHGEVLINTCLNSAGSLDSDTVFVEFDKEELCLYYHPITDECFVPREGNYLETVEPLTIFSEDNQMYSVVDSTRDIDQRDRVKFSGYVSGEIDSVVLDDNRTFHMVNPFDNSESILLRNMIVLYSTTQSGDSGAPLYTHPNSDDEVEIIGSMSGNTVTTGKSRAFAFYWDDIADDLDLDPIP